MNWKRWMACAAVAAWAGAAGAAGTAKPNVIFILADDIGYGDLGCYGAKRVTTPNVDRLASQGLRFTDAHAAGSTCTPSRYSLMTGEYAWRKKGTNILPGDASLIIEPGRLTLPAVMKKAGYTTGVVGKWHLGLGDGNLDWNTDIKPGPMEVGFDYDFLIPATGDRTPCVFVENRRVVGLDPADPIRVNYAEKVGDDPTGRDHPEMLKMKLTHGHDFTIVNGISRIGYMSGGKAARWVDEDIADTITRKAVGFIERSKDRPFFLYFATHDIHVPRVPHPRFVGKTPMGPRGDAIVQFDACVGEVLAALDRLNLAENTMVIVSSDNGPVLDDGYADDAVEKVGDHKPAGPLRGGKYSAFEGGTRMPFIVRWPARVKPGVSDALVCQVDMLASLAKLTGVALPDEAAPDSFDVLAALLGESPKGRETLIEQGPVCGVRKDLWKFIPAGGGGNKGAGKTPAERAARETGSAPGGQLFNLADDIGEEKNLAATQGERLRELRGILQSAQQSGRTRP